MPPYKENHKMKSLKLTLLTLLLPLVAFADITITTIQEEFEIGIADDTTPYSMELACDGCSGSAEWSIIDGYGSLPDGLDINSSTGEISGLISSGASGTYTFTVKVEDGDESDSKEFIIIVRPFKITSDYLDIGRVGDSYNYTLTATETEGVMWRLDDSCDPLPSGLSFDETTGVISGTPASGTDGYHNICVEATVAANWEEATPDYDIDRYEAWLEIMPPVPIITTDNSSPFQFIIGQSGELRVESEYEGYWNIYDVSPELNASLRYDYDILTMENIIDVEPTDLGDYYIELELCDYVYYDCVTKIFDVKVIEPTPPTIITSNIEVFQGMVGEWFSHSFAADQSFDGWEVVGDLPEGLSLYDDGDSAYVHGYPEVQGTFPFTLKVVNSNGSGTKTFNIRILPPPPPTIITESSDLDWGTVGTLNCWYFYSSQEGEWTQRGLPENFDFYYEDAGAIVCGTPTTPDNLNFRLQVENENGSSGFKSFTIRVFGITNATIQPSVSQGSQFTGQLRSNVPAYWSLEGDVPPGLKLYNSSDTEYNGSNTANYLTIRGTAIEQGSYSFTVRAANSYGETTKYLYVNVTELPPLAIYQVNDRPGSVGSIGEWCFYSNQDVKWSIVSGRLPGLELEEDEDDYISDNCIVGTPTEAGNYRFTLKVTNVIGTTYQKEFAIVINPPLWQLQITTPNDQPFDATAGTNAYLSFNSNQEAKWSVIGKLPPGLKLDNNNKYEDSWNAILGIPTKAGSYTFTIRVENNNGSSIKTFTVIVAPAPMPTITAYEEPLRDGIVGKNESWSFYSNQDVKWRVEGNLPPGLSLWEGGYETWAGIHGTPTKAGGFTFTLVATNALGDSYQKNFTIQVLTPNKPMIETTDLPEGTMGENYDICLEATDYAEWSIKSGSLPPGLELRGDGCINGYPTKTGTYKFTVEAKNVTGNNTKQYFLTIDAEQRSPRISYANVYNIWAGEMFGGWMSANRAAHWSLEGDVPPGLSLGNNDYTSSNYFSGTATEVGSYTFTVIATNSISSDSWVLNVIVSEPPMPQITSRDSLNGNVGMLKAWSLEANQNVKWTLVSGELPPGIELVKYHEDYYLYGTPTKAGEYIFKLEIKNVVGLAVEETFTLNITIPKRPEITTNTLPSGIVSKLYFEYLIAVDEAEWSIKSGSLPPGVDFYYEDGWGIGAIWGYPTKAGTYSFTVEARNISGSYTKRFTITVGSGIEENDDDNNNDNEYLGDSNFGIGIASGETSGSLPKISIARNILVSSSSNAILLSNLPQNAKVEVYNLQGKRIYSGNSGNSENLQISIQTKGMYVVKAGNQSMRAIVR